MNLEKIFIIIYVFILVALCVLVFEILSSPFKYPYFRHELDVSGKRLPDKFDNIDIFLNKGNMVLIENHFNIINSWKEECNKKIEKATILKNLRKKQYQKALDDNNAYTFKLTRKKTVYRTHNYVKTSYLTTVVYDTFRCSYDFLKNRNERLENINHECTLREYECRNQRRLVTKELRKKIMERDNYTCQICGKIMKDGVDIHIDHIIPVSKGGKSVSSNLQVLCSKCNLHKSNKIL